MKWREFAVCRDRDPELFFPVGGTGPALIQLADAKEICGGCPVRNVCLEWAIVTGVEYGVWGGLSEDERRSFKRRTLRRRALLTGG